MDDSFLVGVLNGAANLHEKIKPLPCRELKLITVIGDADTSY